MGEVSDDHFHNFVWQAADRFVDGTSLWRRILEQAIGLGFASVPNDHHASHDTYPCGANSAKISYLCAQMKKGAILDAEDMGLSVRPAFLVVGGIVIVVGMRGAPNYY